MNEQTEQTINAAQEQPQVQAQPQPLPPPQYQPQYQPPQPQLQRGRGGGWIALLRVFLWIEFACIVIAGVAGFAVLFNSNELALGILALVASVLLAFLSVALNMVLLDAARNLKNLTDNSALIGYAVFRQEQQGK